MKTTTFFIALLAYVNLLSLPNTEQYFNLVCPEDVWLDCGDDISDLSIYGNAYFEDDYGTHQAGPAEVEYATTGCNTGFIVRTWTVKDEHFNIHTCSQVIQIQGGSFDGHNIYWPDQEVELEGCNPITTPSPKDTILGYPTFDYLTCSQIGINHKDQTFNFGPDCKKIIRTWTVIDWCIHHPQHNPGKGIWNFFQTIKISGTSDPEFECLPELTISSFDCDSAYVALTDIVPSKSDCGGIYTVDHDSMHADTTGNNASGMYPIGIHDITYSISYGCGQVKRCTQKIKVIDDAKPVPYCLGSLTVALMGMDENNDGVNDSGMVEIWAKDLDKGSYHPCGRSVDFSFSTDPDSMFRIFTCDDIGTNEVRMYVSDHYGNQSYCIVEVVVQNNGANIENCEETTVTTIQPSFKAVEGKVDNIESLGLKNAYVSLCAMEPDTLYIEDKSRRTYIYEETLIDSFYNASGEVIYNRVIDSFPVFQYDTIIELYIHDGMTDDQGNFKMDSLNVGFDYKIQTHKISYEGTNINVYDAQSIMDHLSGRKPFESPYQYLAADINFDHFVDTKDVLLLLDFIQGETGIIPINQRWKFVDANFTFDQMDDILKFKYPDYIMVVQDELDPSDKSMKGICIGDVSSLNYETQELIENVDERIIEMRSSIEASSNTNSIIKFAPNPFSDKTELRINSSAKRMQLTIWDVSGRQVMSESVDLVNNEHSVTIDQLEYKGVYFYKILLGDTAFEGKLVKQ